MVPLDKTILSGKFFVIVINFNFDKESIKMYSESDKNESEKSEIKKNPEFLN